MPRLPASLLLLPLLLFAPPAAAGPEDEVRAVLEGQAEAWNSGDVEEFMEGYWKSEKLRFASGGSVTYGWRDTLEGYRQRYDTPEKMGKLSFSKLDIRMLSETHALAFGHWRLKRKEGSLGGVFTLVFERFPEGWRIVHDHTSEDPLPLSVVTE